MILGRRNFLTGFLSIAIVGPSCLLSDRPKTYTGFRETHWWKTIITLHPSIPIKSGDNIKVGYKSGFVKECQVLNQIKDTPGRYLCRYQVPNLDKEPPGPAREQWYADHTLPLHLELTSA